ncbi:MAG: BatA and WFA domain-containing protein [Phycisphaeraceae bacterium]|nr:BatA and WFA domain-containing protein [Phycisphaeraceae bacterium]
MLFLAPIMLAGLAAIAVPVVIHLMDRSKSAAVDWPTLRFLKIARQQSARRTRLKNILVLLARCLILALLAAAFAKPYQTEEEWIRPPNLPTTLVIALDNSYSMGYRDGGTGSGSGTTDANEVGSRFARAKDLALKQIASLSQEDEVALVVFNEQARAMTERPTRDHDLVRKLIKDARLSDFGTSVTPALTLAFAIGNLDAETGANSESNDQNSHPARSPAGTQPSSKKRDAWRQVMLYSDMQESGWRRVVEEKFVDKIASPIPLTIVDLGSTGGAGNRFIRNVVVRDETAGGFLAVEAEVASQDGTASGQQATLWVDGQKATAPETVPLGSNKVTLRAPLPSPGVHTCMVSLQEDRLSVDDRAYFSVNITGGTHVTVVDGDPSDIPSQSETYFLDTALGFARSRSTGLTMDKITPVQLSATPLSKGGCLILANVSRLDGSALTNVENFLRSGGSVVVALGDKVDIAHYNKDWPFLPLRLDRMMGDAARSRAYSVLIEAADHPIFAGVDLSATRYFTFVGADPTTLKPGGKVLASFSNSSPYIVEGTFGGGGEEKGVAGAAGRVLLFTGALDADGSNLPYRRAFVPLVDRVTAYMTRQRLSSRVVMLGQPVRFVGPGTLDRHAITITTPDGETATITAQRDAQGAAVAEYRDTQSVGVYRVEADEGFATGGAFAVNLNTSESILLPIKNDEIKKVWGTHPLRIFHDAAPGTPEWNPNASSELTVKRTEYWPWLLLAAFLVFIGETALANFFTRRRRVEATPGTEYLGTRRNENTLAGIGVTSPEDDEVRVA